MSFPTRPDAKVHLSNNLQLCALGQMAAPATTVIQTMAAS